MEGSPTWRVVLLAVAWMALGLVMSRSLFDAWIQDQTALARAQLATTRDSLALVEHMRVQLLGCETRNAELHAWLEIAHGIESGGPPEPAPAATPDPDTIEGAGGRVTGGPGEGPRAELPELWPGSGSIRRCSDIPQIPEATIYCREVLSPEGGR